MGSVSKDNLNRKQNMLSEQNEPFQLLGSLLIYNRNFLLSFLRMHSKPQQLKITN
jgi:hypothetical protein